MESQENWKSKILITGAVLGLLAGLGASYMLIQRAERQGGQPEMSAGQGVKLGLLVLGLLRQVSELGE